MANRHLARSLAMQILYEWDFAGKEDSKLSDITDYVIKEFGPGLEEDKFVKDLVRGVLSKLKEIDAIIERAAPEWPLEQIAIVDRNVLRVGIFELLFGDRKAVPPKVAINESIELAKSFGGETSGKFINGVLGTIYREIGEPMKDHIKSGGDENIPEEILVGGVITRKQAGKIHVLWLRDKYGFWTFPKGHLKSVDENQKEALVRGIEKEIGLKNSTIGEVCGVAIYISKSTQPAKAQRRVVYYLAETGRKIIKPKADSEISETKWHLLSESPPGDYYHDLDVILERAREILAA